MNLIKSLKKEYSAYIKEIKEIKKNFDFCGEPCPLNRKNPKWIKCPNCKKKVRKELDHVKNWIGGAIPIFECEEART